MKLPPTLLIIALLSAGCANQQPSTSATGGRIGDISNPEAETPPHVGMTKADALALYGRPKKQTVTEEGEQWVYILNIGEVIGKAMIPFNFKPTMARIGILTFWTRWNGDEIHLG